MKSNKDKFKVYSNDNMSNKNQQEEEISVELEVPHEDLVTGLFLLSGGRGSAGVSDGTDAQPGCAS